MKKQVAAITWWENTYQVGGATRRLMYGVSDDGRLFLPASVIGGTGLLCAMVDGAPFVGFRGEAFFPSEWAIDQLTGKAQEDARAVRAKLASEHPETTFVADTDWRS